MEPPFTVTHERGVVALRGDLDLATVPYLRAALVEHEGEAVTVDLAQVGFVDSAGLRAMIEVRRLYPELRFVRPAEQLARLVELTGTATLLFEPINPR